MPSQRPSRRWSTRGATLVPSQLVWFDRSGKAGRFGRAAGSLCPRSVCRPTSGRIAATVMNTSRNQGGDLDRRRGFRERREARLGTRARSSCRPGPRTAVASSTPSMPEEHRAYPSDLVQGDRRLEGTALRRKFRQPEPVGLVAGRPFPRHAEGPAGGKAIQRALDPARVRSEAFDPVRDRSPGSGRRALLSRREVACLHLERIGQRRSLRSPVSGSGRNLEDLDRGRLSAAVAGRRQGDVLT